MKTLSDENESLLRANNAMKIRIDELQLKAETACDNFRDITKPNLKEECLNILDVNL